MTTRSHLIPLISGAALTAIVACWADPQSVTPSQPRMTASSIELIGDVVQAVGRVRVEDQTVVITADEARFDTTAKRISFPQGAVLERR